MKWVDRKLIAIMNILESSDDGTSIKNVCTVTSCRPTFEFKTQKHDFSKKYFVYKPTPDLSGGAFFVFLSKKGNIFI